jgi:carbon storage regulator
MLVLSRKKTEEIYIGDDIRITVVSIGHETVRLGIEAAKEMPIHRKEVYDAIQRNQKDKGGIE